MDPAALARDLDGESFAEAEEFLLDLKRKIVLSKSSNAVVTQQLKTWKRRFGPKAGVTIHNDGGE